jgi:tetratricopeptide (TPR) repeat protein
MKVRAWIGWLLVTLAGVAGLSYGSYLWQRQNRTNRLRQAFEHDLERRDFVNAYALMEDYLRIFPGDAGVHLLAAQAARRAQFQELFSGPPIDFFEETNRHLDDCSRLNGPEESIVLERALLRAQQGELEGSEESLLAYLDRDDPEAPLILEGLIYGYLRTLRLDKARFYLQELLRLQPDNVQALVWRGQLKEQVMNFPSAREDYEEAIRLNPDFATARYYLVANLLWANQAGDAARHLAILENTLAQNPLIRLARAQCEIAQGQTEAGRQRLDDWLRTTPATNPRRLEALAARANVALTLDHPAEAEQYARQALRLAPFDRQALYGLYRSLVAQGRQQEANQVQDQLDHVKKDMEFVSKASTQVGLSPHDLELRHHLGEAYLRLGRTNDALGWFLSVLDQDPAYQPTLQALVEYYEHAGDAQRTAEFRRRLAAAGSASSRQ